MLAYADGSPMRDGDIVLMEQNVLGRVSEVVDSQKQAAERHVQGTGVVVDALPKGYVFLSGTALREASLRLVRRGPNERVRMHLHCRRLWVPPLVARLLFPDCCDS